MSENTENLTNDDDSFARKTRFFYYESDGKVKGPISEDSFFELIAYKEIQHDTLIWGDGDTEWKRLGAAYKINTPPPLPISYISDGFAVGLALTPVIQMLVLRLIDGSKLGMELVNLSNYSPTIFGILVFLYFFITANIFMLADFSHLVKKNIKLGKSILIWGNLIPTYLFYRATMIARLGNKKWTISHLLPFVWLWAAFYFYPFRFF